jgi:hypothetical protein
MRSSGLLVEANEPRPIAFNGYVNEHRSEVTIVQVHRAVYARGTVVPGAGT